MDALDLNHLEKYVAGDPALRDEILSIFLEQVEIRLGDLDVDLEDWAWRDACHALKGAARGVGAWRLGDLAEVGEGLVGGDGDRPRRIALLGDINAAAAATVAAAQAARAAA